MVKLRGHGGHGEETEETPPVVAGLADRAQRGVPLFDTKKQTRNGFSTCLFFRINPQNGRRPKAGAARGLTGCASGLLKIPKV